ncbi:hypothetical protein EKD04_013490 [Chloroflexales bacterium ZM16-3]|nr:hypothetical protein [Chloroflexales bacterium ZM16-3]
MRTIYDAQRAAKELLHRGIPREDVRMEARDASDPHAANGVRRGGVLLTVRIDSAMAERVDVDGALRHYRVVDIDQRRASWHATRNVSSPSETDSGRV